MSTTNRTVVVGLSGGVDSSVAAMLLKQQGYKVIGLFMKNWEDDDTDEYCSSRQDLVDVMSVADKIGIDVEVVNFAKEYKERVFAEFLREYQAGRTPNPDVLCNAEIKFRAFLDHAVAMGAEKIATGHYAGVREFNGEFQLLKAEDGTKDQSYFLHRLNQQQLARTLFPLADLYKREVRRIAAAAGLHVALKKDSTGICFIGERPFKEFLMRYLPPKKGEIRCLDDDQVVGEHDGVAYHTIGQRKGLHIGGVKGGRSGPSGDHDAWFVARKDIASNVLYVVQGHTHPALLADSCPDIWNVAATQSQRAPLLECLAQWQQLTLDGQPLETPALRYYSDPRTAQQGAIAIVPIRNLAPGEHLLSLRRAQRKAPEDHDKAADRYRIAFWK